jgi:hypothetical protein
MGRTAESWDSDDRAKVGHMLKRGKSVLFIHEYTGMPVDLIENIHRRTQRRPGNERNGVNYNWLSKQPPIGQSHDPAFSPDKLRQASREFVMRVRTTQSAKLGGDS